MNRDAVAITGIGVLSSVGLEYDSFAESVTNGVIGFEPAGDQDMLWTAELPDFQVADYLVAEKTYLDRCSELALAATKLCLDQAGLAALPVEPERRGLVLGTQYGCLDTMSRFTERVRKRGPRFATPVMFSHGFLNTPISLVAIDFDIKGYHVPIVSGAGSGNQALLTALVGLWCGHADAVIAGGVEAMCPLLRDAVREGSWTGDDPDLYDPLDPARRIHGEGAAFFLLERLPDATARGAEIHGLLTTGTGPGPTVATGPTAGLDSCPAGLYGDCFGASGALAVAAALAGLQHQTVVPVAGGDHPLADRREPRPSDSRGANLLDTAAGTTPLYLELP